MLEIEYLPSSQIECQSRVLLVSKEIIWTPLKNYTKNDIWYIYLLFVISFTYLMMNYHFASFYFWLLSYLPSPIDLLTSSPSSIYMIYSFFSFSLFFEISSESFTLFLDSYLFLLICSFSSYFTLFYSSYFYLYFKIVDLFGFYF